MHSDLDHMNPVTAPPVRSATMVMTALGVPPLFYFFLQQRYNIFLTLARKIFKKHQFLHFLEKTI